MSDPHPFFARHILREARRGKHARISPKIGPLERLELQDLIARAAASGFVLILHAVRCSRDYGRPRAECERHELADCPFCSPCSCLGGPAMDLTTEGARELARVEDWWRGNPRGLYASETTVDSGEEGGHVGKPALGAPDERKP